MHNDAFFQCGMSENYVKVEIWVLHSQFTNSHFHLHITVQMKTLNGASVSQNPLLHSCCVHTHPSCAELNSAQSNMLHSQFTITTHLYQLSVYLNGENKVCPQEPNHTSYIFIGVHFLHHHFASTYPINSIQLALVPPVECYSYCKCYPLWKHKCSIHKSYKLVNLIFMRDILLCVQ